VDFPDKHFAVGGFFIRRVEIRAQNKFQKIPNHEKREEMHTHEITGCNLRRNFVRMTVFGNGGDVQPARLFIRLSVPLLAVA